MELETALVKAIDTVSTALTPQIITGPGNQVFYLEWDNLNKITTNVHGSNVVNSTGGIMIQEVKPGYEFHHRDQPLPTQTRTMMRSVQLDTPETLPLFTYTVELDQSFQKELYLIHQLQILICILSASRSIMCGYWHE